MRNKLVKALCGKKEMINRYGLQLFADNPGEGQDDDIGGDPENDSDDDLGTGGGNPEKKYTDEDVDRMFERKFAEWQKRQEKEQKKKDEAERLKNMNAQQKSEYEKEQLEKRLNELIRKDTLSEMSKTARSMLSDKGINVSDTLLDMMVSEDADATKSAVDSFIVAFQDAVKSAVKDALKGETPKTGSSSGITKEQILAVKNRAERQKLIKENMSLFK